MASEYTSVLLITKRVFFVCFSRLDQIVAFFCLFFLKEIFELYSNLSKCLKALYQTGLFQKYKVYIIHSVIFLVLFYYYFFF